MDTTRTIFTLLAAHCVFSAGCREPDPHDKSEPNSHQRESPKPAGPEMPAAAKARLTSFEPAILPVEGGHVTAVTKESITIRTMVRKDLVTFPFHDALAAGGVQKYASGSTAYRARDVRIGDEVWLSICAEAKGKFCAEINIRNRPGGRVPEAVVDSLKPSYADRQNAKNDFNDFGIPIPERFNKRLPVIKYSKERDEELRKVIEELNAKNEKQSKK